MIFSGCVFFIESMFRGSQCVFCSISLVFEYVCLCLPFSPWSIAGVPSGQALPGYLIAANHLCAFLMYFAR